jgi:hypothetical protein
MWKVNANKILVGRPEEKTELGRTCRKGEVILKWILGKPILRAWIGFVCFSIGISGGHL